MSFMYEVKENIALNIWEQVLDKIKNELDVNAVSTFFLPIVAKDFKNKTLILEAPTRFVKEVVSSEMFANKIKRILKEILGIDAEFEIKEHGEYVVKEEKQEEIVKSKTILQSNLNEDFVFDNFVVGHCNIECQRAALAVAEEPGKNYNPLFIYGRAGIGKTHLLHAIGNYCKTNINSRMNVYYTTANDFIDEFMRSSQNKDLESMKSKFKSIDMLLLDDVQFLAGKDKTGEVFFQIFNNLFNEKKQIVLTSDRNPNELKGLESRLVSRFSFGLTVGMNAPEQDTAKAILRRKINSKNFEINNVEEAVLDFIAQNYSTDVRQLEGALTRLFFYVTTINKTDVITLPMAIEALKNVTPPKKTSNDSLNADEIKKTVCDYYKISLAQLTGSGRAAGITTPRYIAIYLCRIMLNMTFIEIGKEFGNRDHSTIMNACIKVEKCINEDDAYKLVIHKLQQLLTK